MDEGYQPTKEPFSARIIHFIQEIWPSVYRTINDVLMGIIGFIKDTVTGLWR